MNANGTLLRQRESTVSQRFVPGPAGLLLLLLAGASFSPGQPVVSPAAPTVRIGESVAFTANQSVVWSLAPGSAGSITPQGVFTAPLSIPVKQKAGPCQLLPSDHIYNTPVDNLPVHPNSATLTTLGSSEFRIQFQPALGLNILTNDTPTFDAVFLYTPRNNGPFQILSWPQLIRQTGVFTPIFGGVDRHVIAVNRETCEFSDIYNNYPAGTLVGIPGLPNCPLCTSASGVKYFSDHTLPINGASDAAGMALQPVTLRLSDMQSGVIQHALRFTMSNSYIKPSHVWPATTHAFPWCSGTCWEYGMHARLKRSFDISRFSPAAQIILTALKRYGMILADGGTSWAIATHYDVFLDHPTRSALREILFSSLRNSDFEAVDTSSLKISPSSGAVSLSNGYTTPSQFAEVIATSPSGQQARVRINLRGVSVGVPKPAVTIMGGHQAQLTAWVTGTSNTAVTWRIEPNLGSITAGGLYRAPSGLTSPATLRAFASSVAAPSESAQVDITVWPETDGGAIRIDVGGTSNYTDSKGRVWFQDSHSRFEAGITYLTNHPGAFPPGTPNYYFSAYRHFADSFYRWYLPNGNYKVTLHMSLSDRNGPIEESHSHLESQGQIARHRVSLSAVTGGFYGRGGSVSIPMQVTDGSGYFAQRYLAEGYPVLSALEVSPDPTPPHIEIDAPSGSLPSGTPVQLRAVGWYMSPNVNWQLVSGPGVVDANGLFTNPAAASGSVSIIRATSSTDPSQSATAVVEFAGNSSAICAFTIPGKPSFSVPASGGTVAVNVKSSTPGCTLNRARVAISGAVSGHTLEQDAIKLSMPPNASPAALVSTLNIAGLPITVIQAPQNTSGLLFVPITPCRILDTRTGGGKSGRFGPPSLAAQDTREIPVLASGCSIPPIALAYSLTVTAVPPSPLAFLTLYAWGQPLPLASTLNSFNGRVTANSTVVPAGVDGSVALYASNKTDAVIDISGYFVPPPSTQGLAFYPIVPCRAVDTRSQSGKTGSFGAPALAAGVPRSFNLPASGCGIPASAQAYALNITALPTRTLGYLTAYPTGEERSLSSILNSWDGQITAASVLVRSGTAGSVTLFAPEETNIITDITGYFAPPAPGGLYFYPTTPCRLADTRSSTPLAAQTSRIFPVAAAGCGIPSSARALAGNVTTIPINTLGYLTVWPAGSQQPNISLLNSWNGQVVANFAVKALGTGSAWSIFASDTAHIVLDSLGYFQ